MERIRLRVAMIRNLVKISHQLLTQNWTLSILKKNLWKSKNLLVLKWRVWHWQFRTETQDGQNDLLVLNL